MPRRITGYLPGADAEGEARQRQIVASFRQGERACQLEPIRPERSCQTGNPDFDSAALRDNLARTIESYRSGSITLPLASAPNANLPGRGLSSLRVALVTPPDGKLAPLSVARPLPNGVPNRSFSRAVAAIWPTLIREGPAPDDRRSPLRVRSRLCPPRASSAAVISSLPLSEVPARRD